MIERKPLPNVLCKKVPLKEVEVNNFWGKRDVVINEENNSIWGLLINEKLKKAEDKINEYRFMSISLKEDGSERELGQGIWTLKEAIDISKRLGRKTLSQFDYSEYEYNKVKCFCFDIKPEVFDYLVEKNVFVLSDSEEKRFTIEYPQLFGERESVLDISISVFDFLKEGCQEIIFQISSKK